LIGVHLGPVDTIFSLSGLLMIASGAFGMLALPRESPGRSPVAASENA
jgi:hypothetical protein